MEQQKITVTYDSDMQSAELDKITLDSRQKKAGLFRLILGSAIGILVFFVSVPHNGESEIIFSIIYNAIINLFGNAAYWILVFVIGLNFFCHVITNISKRDNANLLLQKYMKMIKSSILYYMDSACYMPFYMLCM